MKVLKEIKNVLDYAITSNQLIILNTEENQIKLFDNDFNQLSEVKSIENHREILIVNSNKLAVKDNKAQLHFFELSEESKLKIDLSLNEKFKEYKYPFINQLKKNDLKLETYFLLSRKNEVTKSKELYQVSILDEFTINWKLENQGLKSINGNYYDHEVTKYDGDNGALLWRSPRSKFLTPYVEDFNLRKEVKEDYIRNLIGTYNQTIWISLTSGRLIGLNNESGKVEYSLSGESCDYSKIDINGNPKLPLYGGRIELNKSSNELFTIVGSTFVRLDLSSPTLSIHYQNIKKGDNQLEIEVSMGKVSNIPSDEKNYYVIDNYKNHIGNINKSNLQNEEIIDLGMNNGLIVDFRLYNDKLYVKNQDNTLRVISIN